MMVYNSQNYCFGIPDDGTKVKTTVIRSAFMTCAGIEPATAVTVTTALRLRYYELGNELMHSM
jgi:hypothetical protein